MTAYTHLDATMFQDTVATEPSLDHFECRLANDLEQVSHLTELLSNLAVNRGFRSLAQRHRIAVPLEEALVNAIVHGNLEIDSQTKSAGDDFFWETVQLRRNTKPYIDRFVQVRVDLTDDCMIVVIRDEGPGFDPGKIADPTQSDNLEIPFGRGLLLMRSFMDEVGFNATGNEVTLTARRESSHAHTAT